MPDSTSFWEHPIDKLEEALSLRKQIAALQGKLSGLFGSGESKASPASSGSKKNKGRTVSAETRAKMAAAQQARHARKAGVSAPSKPVAAKSAAPAASTDKKGGITPEGRAKLAAAMKARWAARAKGGPAPTESKADASAPATPSKSKAAGKASGKRKPMSPETRAKLAEAAKQRWAKRKSE